MEFLGDDDLLRHLAIPHRHARGTTLEFFPARPHPAQDVAQKESTAGHFDLLPLEIIYSILEMIDVLSVFSFGCASAQTNSLARSLLAYRDVVRYAPGALKALCKTGMLSTHPLHNVHHVLTHSECLCGDFGPFLYLPTCRRVCLNCLPDDQALLVMSPPAAQAHFALTKAELEGISRIRAVPGTYGPPDRFSQYFKHTTFTEVVSFAHAEAIAIRKYGDYEAIACAVREADAERNATYLAAYNKHKSREPITGKDRESPDPPATSGSIAWFSIRSWPYMVSTPMPYLANTRDLQDGVWCVGCQPHQNDNEHGNRIVAKKLERRAFDRAGFLEHARQCSGAKSWVEKNLSR